MSADGYRTLGVAVLKVDKRDAYAPVDERDMTLAGLAAFLDPPRKEFIPFWRRLKQNGVSVVIMTGDNQYVTQKIAHDVGLPTDHILTGNQVDTMDDAALAYQAENSTIFARVSPEQKNRVILALKARGHVVGYIGDGINEAPSLHTADVRHSSNERRWMCAKDAANHPAREGSGGLERRGNRRAALLCQHHEVHHHGHQFKFWQYVQYGSGVALPAISTMLPTQSC